MNTTQEKLISEITIAVPAHREFICRSRNFESIFNCTGFEGIEAGHEALRPIQIEFENNLKPFFTFKLSQKPDELQLLHQQVVGEIDPSRYWTTIEGISQEDIFILMSKPTNSGISEFSVCHFNAVYLRGKIGRSEKKASYYEWTNNILRAASYPEVLPKDVGGTFSIDTALQSGLHYNYLKGALDGFIINEFESRLMDKSEISRFLEGIRLRTDESVQSLVAQPHAEFNKALQAQKICR